MLRIIFLSTMFSDVERDIKLSKRPNPVSGHKFQENLAKGLEQNGCDLSIINISRIRSYPDYPKAIFRKQYRTIGNCISTMDIGFINLPIINYLSQLVTVYAALRKEIKKKDSRAVLMTFNSNLHTCFPILLARVFCKKSVILCNVVGDIHGAYGLTNHKISIKGNLVRGLEKIQDFLGKKFDTFVFLTDYMAKAMGVERKPYVVLEGLYTLDGNTLSPVQNEDKQEKVVFYAGSLHEEYGIAHLLRAFSMIKDNDYRLWLAGSGNSEPLIKTYIERDPRIAFLGVITPQEVEERQKSATVLISPRTSDHEFVKYSFPSKTMECLASGKPYIAHRLPCDPSEYGDYIQYADNDSDEALCDKIIEVCSMSKEQRQALGEHSRQFILEHKNPKKQCASILAMLEVFLIE